MRSFGTIIGLLAAVLCAVGADSALGSSPATNGTIAFSRLAACDSSRCHEAHIWTAAPDASGESELTSDPRAIDAEPAYSPDGHRMTFERCGQYGPCAIYVMDANGQHQQQLTHPTDGPDGYPVFSPDGQKITFEHSAGGSAHIWVMDASGGNQVQVTSGNFDDHHPSFSPDGTRIVFQRAAGSSSTTQLYAAAAAAGARPIQLLSDGTSDKRPSYSSDGTHILFGACSSSTATCRIEAVSVADASVTTLTSPGPGTQDWDPRSSPDGTRIVFDRTAPVDSIAHIFTAPAAGGAATQLTRGDDHTATWQALHPPSFGSPPQVTGMARSGQTLTAVAGAAGDGTSAFSWLRCDATGQNCGAIAGADGTAYSVVPADVGARLKVRQTETNVDGSAFADSVATDVVVRLAVVAPDVFGRTLLSLHSARVARSGVVRIRVSCPAQASVACHGRLVLTSVGPVVLRRAARGRRRRAAVLTFASASFDIASGRSAEVRLRLSGQGLKLLRSSGRLRSIAVLTASDGLGIRQASLPRVALALPGRRHHRA